ncbi:MAG: DUF2165 domain-containing protein [Opitutales bacterium]|nr:DUF2165 domain-containing protein [Opitutales bacterium]NRA26273.1 DUF2165 domain-containing protein [Opitutales bacterium]
MTVARLLKIALVATTGLFFLIVTFNNAIDDYPSNRMFVERVLSIDSLQFEGTAERVDWRAITSPTLHAISYAFIIAWEGATAILCFIGVYFLVKNLKADEETFHKAKPWSVAGLGLGMMLWFFGFITMGGEWFFMWASTWNGQDAAWRMFGIQGISLIFLMQKE